MVLTKFLLFLESIFFSIVLSAYFSFVLKLVASYTLAKLPLPRRLPTSQQLFIFNRMPYFLKQSNQSRMSFFLLQVSPFVLDRNKYDLFRLLTYIPCSLYLMINGTIQTLTNCMRQIRLLFSQVSKLLSDPCCSS